jgi:hypothetical protein
LGRTLDGLVGVPPRNLLVVRIVSAEVIFEAVFAAPRAVVGIEAVAVAALHGRPVMLAVGVGFGSLGAVRDLGAGVVVFAGSAEGLLGDLPLLHDGIALSLDFSFALAVGGLGLLEDVDNVLALGAGSQ